MVDIDIAIAKTIAIERPRHRRQFYVYSYTSSVEVDPSGVVFNTLSKNMFSWSLFTLYLQKILENNHRTMIVEVVES